MRLIILDNGHGQETLVPEQTDTPLSERVRRANGIAAMNSISQVLLVSVHVNAAGIAGTASGWEIHTSPGRTKADEYAQYFWDAANRILGDRFPIRGDWEDGEGDRDSDLYILRRTACPAVLTENLFMDNEIKTNLDIIKTLHTPFLKFFS